MNNIGYVFQLRPFQVELGQFSALGTIRFFTRNRINHKTAGMKPFNDTVRIFAPNHPSFIWSITVAVFLFKLKIESARWSRWISNTWWSWWIYVDYLNATWSCVPLTKSSGRIHVFKKSVFTLATQSFCSSLKICSMWIPLSSPLNVHAQKWQYSTSLRTVTSELDSSRHGCDLSEAIHLSLVEGKTCCL